MRRSASHAIQRSPLHEIAWRATSSHGIIRGVSGSGIVRSARRKKRTGFGPQRVPKMNEFPQHSGGYVRSSEVLTETKEISGGGSAVGGARGVLGEQEGPSGPAVVGEGGAKERSEVDLAEVASLGDGDKGGVCLSA